MVPYARNVEVTGSHVGMAFNRKAYVEIAETLHREARAARWPRRGEGTGVRDRIS